MVDRPASIIPNPDPSIVTSEAMDRRVDTAIAVVIARMDGMQKAVDVFQSDLTRVPTQLDRAISGLRELMESKLEGSDKERQALMRLIFLKIDEVEARVKQHWAESKEAVDSAFIAAKETTNKIETSFTKTIDGQQQWISDLKERLTAVENRSAGVAAANADLQSRNQDSSTRIMSMIAIGVALGVGIVEILLRGH
jgi:hypothetical protein